VGLAAARVRSKTGRRKPLPPDEPRVRMACTMYADQRLPCWTSAARSVSRRPRFTGMWRWADARQTPRNTTEGSLLTAGSSWRMV
jgi:hypothetical protein